MLARGYHPRPRHRTVEMAARTAIVRVASPSDCNSSSNQATSATTLNERSRFSCIKFDDRLQRFSRTKLHLTLATSFLGRYMAGMSCKVGVFTNFPVANPCMEVTDRHSSFAEFGAGNQYGDARGPSPAKLAPIENRSRRGRRQRIPKGPNVDREDHRGRRERLEQ